MPPDTPEAAWGREALLVLLRDMQWLPTSAGYVCKGCANGKHDGHAPDCPIAALIRRGEAMVKETE